VTSPPTKSRAVVWFTRDLRLHDNPTLEAASRSADEVIPLFVLDPRLRHSGANRHRYLHGCLHDLRANLRSLGGDLIVRHGEPVSEVLRLARAAHAEHVVVSSDVSAYAQDRWRKLSAACQGARVSLIGVDSHYVVPAGQITPAGSDHYKVFTPYWRAWAEQPWRSPARLPRRINVPSDVDPGNLPEVPAADGRGAPAGETAARRRMDHWLRRGVAGYGDRHDDLAGDATSRLSADLHFGTLSALELAGRARQAEGGETFLRQLCWRDFHAQVTAAFPEMPYRDYRPRQQAWRDDPGALAAWKAGMTGYPIIDAGMRQLAAEGFMHNRARLLTASFLTKNLGIHWTQGARHFFDLLTDGDVSNNSGNWQWVAGTGNDTRPNRRFNPLRQAHRFDPDGSYVRRYVPELAAIEGGAVHEPWKLAHPPRYAAPLVDVPDARN